MYYIVIFFRCAEAIPAIAGSSTVCSNLRPFKISVHSDDKEYGFPVAAGEGSLANNRGFLIGIKSIENVVC